MLNQQSKFTNKNVDLHHWLVVYQPSEKYKFVRLGWWHSQLIWNNNPVMFQTTNQYVIIFPLLLVYSLLTTILTITINQIIIDIVLHVFHAFSCFPFFSNGSTTIFAPLPIAPSACGGGAMACASVSLPAMRTSSSMRAATSGVSSTWPVMGLMVGQWWVMVIFWWFYGDCQWFYDDLMVILWWFYYGFLWRLNLMVIYGDLMG